MTDIKLPGSWADQFPSWVGYSKVLDTAIASIATTFVGCRKGDAQLIRYSTASYATALRLLRSAMDRPDAKYRDDLVATALVMTLIEIFIPTETGAGWQLHVEGGCTLLTTRGPKMRNTTFVNDLILIARHQGLYGALCSRKEYLFTKAEWRQVINARITNPNASRNIFFDKWCETALPIPSILKKADDLEDTFANDPVKNGVVVESLLDSISEIEQEIITWYESVTATIPAPIEYANLPTPPATGEELLEKVGTQYDALFPNPLHFASVEVAILHILYWVVQLLVHDTRKQLLKHLPSGAHSKQLLEDQSLVFASLVCRSVHFCSSDTSTVSVEELYMPLFVCVNYYARIGDEEKMRWGVELFERFERERGFKMGMQLKKTGEGKWAMTSIALSKVEAG